MSSTTTELRVEWNVSCTMALILYITANDLDAVVFRYEFSSFDEQAVGNLLTITTTVERHRGTGIE
jgi:hypothetical protein